MSPLNGLLGAHRSDGATIAANAQIRPDDQKHRLGAELVAALRALAASGALGIVNRVNVIPILAAGKFTARDRIIRTNTLALAMNLLRRDMQVG